MIAEENNVTEKQKKSLVFNSHFDFVYIGSWLFLRMLLVFQKFKNIYFLQSVLWLKYYMKYS